MWLIVGYRYSFFFAYFFFFQAEDGIRDLVRSRGLGDVYKRQPQERHLKVLLIEDDVQTASYVARGLRELGHVVDACLLYTSDAADERSSVDLGGRRIIKKKTNKDRTCTCKRCTNTRRRHKQ